MTEELLQAGAGASHPLGVAGPAQRPGGPERTLHFNADLAAAAADLLAPQPSEGGDAVRCFGLGRIVALHHRSSASYQIY